MTDSAGTLPTAVAMIGLGEAGRAIAADLVALGVRVVGWDPVVKQVDGVLVTATAPEAARGAPVILSVNSASASRHVVQDLLPELSAGQVFADLNTGSPALKQELGDLVAPTGGLFVDIALMTPVPGNGLRTPSLASGPGARRFLELMAPLGMPVEYVDEQPGSAAARKLLRSIFIKGLHAAFLEGYNTAAKLGWTDWYLGEVGTSLDVINAAAIERILKGSKVHAVRRIHEMEAAADLVREAGLTARVSVAAAEILRELSQSAEEPT